MIGHASTTKNIVDQLLQERIYVIVVNYPVVLKGTSRIRLQISITHEKVDLDSVQYQL